MDKATGAVKAFYATQAWKRTRAAYKQMAGGLCERCLSFGLYEPGTQVHHKQKLTDENVNDQSIATNFDNLMLLCDKCHEEMHRSAVVHERWTVDDDGNVILPL